MITRRVRVQEIWLVFALSLGADALSAFVSFIGVLTSSQSIGSQVTVLNGSRAPGRPLLDLAFQIVALITMIVPVFLVAHFLARDGETMRDIGFDLTQPVADLTLGAGLAAVVGGAGLVLVVIAHRLGLNVQIVAENLPAVWWRIPILLLSAAANGLLEEVLVAGYLLHRLDQLGWSKRKALAVSATLRGSYHLYQGVGGFVGNAVMGVIFGTVYQRRGRTAPLVVAHTLMDAFAFIGYLALAGHVSWLPG